MKISSKQFAFHQKKMCVFIFFLLTPPRERGNLLSFLLGMLMSSGRGGGRGGWGSGSGGGWSDGGGFSGGGGSSGGGGASGSW